MKNIRRIAEVSGLMMDAGLVVIAAIITPYEKERKIIGDVMGEENFLEVFVDRPLEEC